MQLKLNVEIKKLSAVNVIETLRGYVRSLGFTGKIRDPAWYLGYACALRDTGIIDQFTWGELTDRVNNKELLELMQRYAERDK